MHLPAKSPELLLKYGEYIDTWEGLIQSLYQQIISDDAVYTALCPDKESQPRFCMELGTVLLVSAMRFWNAKKLREDVRGRVADDVIRVVYAALFSPDGDALEEYLRFYETRSQIFLELSAPKALKNEAELRGQMIGFARFTVAQCSQRDEKENAAVIEALSIHLIGAATVFLRLTENTVLDGNSMLGKHPRFIVKK